jgi:oxygen-independent coproporphyrinogen-3 oxidase
MTPGVLCYVHLPFCDRICPYCDFAVVEFAQSRVERYLRALRAELGAVAAPAEPVRSIYFGGGTPSALGGARIAALLADLYARLAILRGSIECTLEANPSRNIEDLAAYRAAGVNRLSIGVQSFDDAELHRLGRDHTGDEAVRFVNAARAAGFDNCSIDLIVGVPGQTTTSFARTIECALACAPEHISVYGLTIEAGTPYATWHARSPNAFPHDDAVADLLEKAEAILCAAGMTHYEISNFARPGFECRHNRGYWQQRDCIALGMSASGYASGVRYHNARGFDDYCAALETGRSPRAEEEKLDDADRVGEAAMLALRTSDGIRDDEFHARFGIDARAVFARPIKECRDAGLLEETRGGVRHTARGRLLANTACSEFLHPTLLPPPLAIGLRTT